MGAMSPVSLGNGTHSTVMWGILWRFIAVSMKTQSRSWLSNIRVRHWRYVWNHSYNHIYYIYWITGTSKRITVQLFDLWTSHAILQLHEWVFPTWEFLQIVYTCMLLVGTVHAAGSKQKTRKYCPNFVMFVMDDFWSTGVSTSAIKAVNTDLLHNIVCLHQLISDSQNY